MSLITEMEMVFEQKEHPWHSQLAHHLCRNYAITHIEHQAACLAIINVLGEALTVGHTCVLEQDLSVQLRTQLSQLIALGLCVSAADGMHQTAPMVIEYAATDHRLYFYRQWLEETQLAQNVFALSQHAVQTQTTAAHVDTLNALQQQALITALSHPLCIITGGPGTGKTYTLVQIVKYLQQARQVASPLRIALAAPTGKAAQRMQSLLAEQFNHAQLDLNHIKPATTIHRLLGMGSNNSARSHLPYDVIVIDEASMLDLNLAHQLLQAISPPTRLILLGDSNQLAAVEAGAVLRELTSASCLKKQHCTLTQSRRFDSHSGLGLFAQHILTGTLSETDLTQNSQIVWHTFHNHAEATNGRLTPQNTALTSFYQTLAQGYQPYFDQLRALAENPMTLEQASQLLALFNQYRILTPTHHSPYGTKAINTALNHIYYAHQSSPQQSSSLYPSQPYSSNKETWYTGKPVMLTQNHAHLGLSNGDIAICIWHSTQWQLYFENARLLPVSQLNPVVLQTAYAMTIHKSQGSEFERIGVILPPIPSDNSSDARSLLSRELIYTAATRAKTHIHLWANFADLVTATTQQYKRYSGLANKIDDLACH